MKRAFLACAIAAAAALGWLSYTEYGDGHYSGGVEFDYTFHRFMLGDRVLEVHLGRLTECG